MRTLKENKRGFLQLFGLPIGVLILLAVVLILVFAGTIAFITINKFAIIGGGLIALTLIFGLRGGKFSKKKATFMGALIVVGLVFVLASGTLQQMTGDNFVKPQWARLECAPTDSYEGKDIAMLDKQLEFPCSANTIECRMKAENTESGFWASNVRTNYKVCNLDGSSCTSWQSLKIGNGETETLSNIAVGKKYVFIEDGFDEIGYRNAKVTMDWKQWKTYRFVGGAKFEAKSDTCKISSSDKDQILWEDRGVFELSKIGGPGDKWINYVDNWVYGPATNVFDYNGEEIYCSAATLYDIVEVRVADGTIRKVDPTYEGTREDGTRLSGLGNRIKSVDCCPNEPGCNDDFEWEDTGEEDECVSDIQCFNAGGPVPQSGTSYTIYQCINNKCIESSPITTECTTNAQCASGEICDLSTTNYGKCIEETIGPHCGDGICQSWENIEECPADCYEGLECSWFEYETTSIEKDYGFAYWRAYTPFADPIETPVDVCRTKSWVLWAGFGVIVAGLGALAIRTYKPRRRKR